MVDRRREAMKIGHEHIDIAIGGVFVGEINHGFVGTKKIADSWLFVCSDPC
jgi:hypothetical protein